MAFINEGQTASEPGDAVAESAAIDRLLDAITRPSRRPVTEQEAQILRAATRHAIPHFGITMAGFVWSAPDNHAANKRTPKRVLLLHGWESRAAQFSTLIASLVSAGHEVCSYDAPAHGDSPGERTDVMAMGEAVLSAAEYFGAVHTVVAHSLGSPAALYAFSRGLNVLASVHLCGPSSLVRALERGAHHARLSPQGATLLAARFEALAGRPAHTMDLDRLEHGMQHAALLLHDPEDPEVPYSESLALADVWRNATLEPVIGVGHRRIVKDPAVINQIIVFLDGHASIPTVTDSPLRRSVG